MGESTNARAKLRFDRRIAVGVSRRYHRASDAGLLDLSRSWTMTTGTDGDGE